MPLVTLLGCLTSRICDILLATPITNTPIYLLLDSCGSNFCGSAPVTGTSAMYSLKPPIIMEPLRLSKQQLEGVVKHATLAQESEVSAGNIVYQCKVSSDLYQYLRAEILEKQAAATLLAHNGLLPPHVAQSYSQHLADAAEDEAYNLAVQAVAVDLEAYFDEAETELDKKISALKSHLAVLQGQYAAAVAMKEDFANLDWRMGSRSSPAGRKRRLDPTSSTATSGIEAD